MRMLFAAFAAICGLVAFPAVARGQVSTISAQCHWISPDLNLAANGPSHTHNDITVPTGILRTTSAPFAVPIAITLFQTRGSVVSVSGDLISNIVFDNGVTLPLAGNPTGVVTYTGIATVDPSLGIASGRVPQHGWYQIGLSSRTNYANTDVLINMLDVPAFSVVDTTVPQLQESGANAIRTATRCKIGSHLDNFSEALWATQLTEVVSVLLPSAPLTPSAPWTGKVLNYNYPAQAGLLPPGTFRVFLDPDLHNGMTGTELLSVTEGPDVFVSLPGTIPAGAHKVQLNFSKPTFDGLEDLNSILVFGITVVDDGTLPPPPPAEVCGDGVDNDGDGQVDEGCVVVPPPPPPPPAFEWRAFTESLRAQLAALLALIDAALASNP